VTAAQFVGLALQASIFLLVFALGLNASLDDVLYLLRRPALLARAILSMNVVMLAFVLAIIELFGLPPAVRIALVALAVSPVPPILPSKQVKAGGPHDYSIGLLVAIAIISVVLVPATIEFIGRGFGVDVHMPARRVAPIVLTSILVPLLAGVGVARIAPALAGRAARPISQGAMLLLVIAVLPALFAATPALAALIGNGVVACLFAFALVGLAVGHLLGGPDPDDRTALALATSSRHPAIAIAIARINFPDEQAVMGIVLYFTIVSAIVALPYVKWRTKLHAGLV
jgi:BASS family bile acid:Na+ symporter